MKEFTVWVKNLASLGSLEQVADFFDLSPKYFSRKFKAYTGVDFTEERLKRNIKKAKALLLDPDRTWTVIVISKMLGYGVKRTALKNQENILLNGNPQRRGWRNERCNVRY